MRALTAPIFAFISLGALTLAQEKPQFFRSSTVSVPIYATVVDQNGRLVPDLTQADFEVTDNLKPAAVTNFVAEVLPISVVVALDMSGSMTSDIGLAKNAAEAFMLRLLPHDRARVVSFDDKVRWGPDFTNDRDKLIAHLRDGIQFGNGTAIWDALYESISVLKPESARKVVIVLSDGDDSASKRAGDDEVLEAAQTSDVMIYTVGLRTRYCCWPGGGMREGRPDRNLKKHSEHTGGGFFELTKATELNSTFTRVADELHRQYLLAITAQQDGKPHTIGVRVKRPGMTVRARKTYIAAPPAK